MTDIMASKLKGRAVVSLAAAEKIGIVATLILDPATAELRGLKVKTGLVGTKSLRVTDIRSVGADAVTIVDRTVLHEHESEMPDLKDLPTFDDLLRTKVVSQGGTLLGMLGDVELDLDHYRIIRYEMSGNLWAQMTHSQRSFPAVGGLRFGKDLLIVPDDVAAALSAPGRGVTSGERPAPAGPVLPPDENPSSAPPAGGAGV